MRNIVRRGILTVFFAAGFPALTLAQSQNESFGGTVTQTYQHLADQVRIQEQARRDAAEAEALRRAEARRHAEALRRAQERERERQREQ